MADEQVKGRIFNIQRYSIHDGQGIRTIVFFKGCLLRCKWCCNPESHKYEIETMRQNNTVEVVGKDITVSEAMAVVEQDRAYYRRSGGGLTLSGGEALLQPHFALHLLAAAKELGIHTAIESTAMAEYSVIEKILPYLDEFLMDIKHTDQIKHEKFTGKRNDLALENAKKIAAANVTKLIIRVPVIPGFNATEQEIESIARFAAALPNVNEMHLLPYHGFGEGKYAALGREYTMGDAAAPDNITMKRLKAAAERAGDLTVQIGG